MHDWLQLTAQGWRTVNANRGGGGASSSGTNASEQTFTTTQASGRHTEQIKRSFEEVCSLPVLFSFAFALNCSQWRFSINDDYNNTNNIPTTINLVHSLA